MRRFLVGKLEGKRPLGSSRQEGVDNIKIDLGRDRIGLVWTGLVWLRIGRDKWRALVNSVMNLQVPENAGKLSSGLTTGGFSSSVQLPS
jgi:hypothetical protein